MKIRIEVLLLGAALIAGAWLFYSKYGSRVGIAGSLPNTNSAATQDTLVTDQRAQVFYKLPIKEQQRLFKAVEQFCGKQYHRDSCVHHLATCGFPCMVVVPRDQRKRIFEDYQALRKDRGLPPLTVLPGHQEE